MYARALRACVHALSMFIYVSYESVRGRKREALQHRPDVGS